MVVDLGIYLLVKVFIQFISAFILLCSFSTLAFTPTASQIEQFKKLPKAQQEALAKQYGVDVSTITGTNQSNNENNTEQKSTVGERAGARERAANR